MTVSSSAVKAGPYPGNGVATSFVFNFKVVSASDLRVVRTVIDTLIEADLELDTDYSVTLNADQDNDPGGSITYPLSGSPLPATLSLTLVSNVAALQAVSLTNAGGFYPKIIENALDRLTLLVAQLEEQMARAVLADVAGSIDPADLVAALAAAALAATTAAAEADADAAAADASAIAAALSAASTNLPSLVGKALHLLRVNAAATGYETRTPTQTLSDIGGASLAYVDALPRPPIRQTVFAGPVDANGLPSFGGATGATTVTAAGTLTLTAAGGFSSTGGLDRVGQIVNPSWPGLNTNGTMYLWLDVNADGTCTPGSGTLVPSYRWGGADVITANQFTFNIQEMKGKVGNGAAAVQTYRVYVGEVTVAAGVVTTITWYALQGRYYNKDTGVPSPTRISKNHNIGAPPQLIKILLECQTIDQGYLVGEQVPVEAFGGSSGQLAVACSVDRLALGVVGNTAALYVAAKTTGSFLAFTASSWDTVFVAQRGW